MPRDTKGIRITTKMIEAGLQYLRDEAFPMLTIRAEDPDFVRCFLRAAVGGGRATLSTAESTSAIKLRKSRTKSVRVRRGTGEKSDTIALRIS